MAKLLYQKTFHSIRELAELTAARKDAKVPHKSSIDTGLMFYGGMNHKQAVDMARAGGRWDDGVLAIKSATDAITAAPPRPRKRRRHSVAGFAPVVPRALTGNPLNMLANTIQPDPARRILKLGIAVGRSASIKQEHAVNRGAAILRVIEELETNGTQVEIWACWRNKNDDGDYVSIETRIKPANMPFTPADCAFALCHVAFQRRLCWSAAELAPNNEASPVLGSGYGNGVNVDTSDFDAYVPYTVPDHIKHLHDADSAYAFVKVDLTKQLQASKGKGQAA